MTWRSWSETWGDRAKRVELNRLTLIGRTRSLGAEHPDTLRSLGNLAWALNAVGELDEAERCARESLAVRVEVLGDAHEETQWSRRALPDVLVSRGHTDEAEAVLRECVEVCQRLRPVDDPETLLALTLLGQRLRGTF